MTAIELYKEIDPDAADEALFFVDGHIIERPYKFLLDTGAARSAIIQDEFNAQLEPVGRSGGSGAFMPSDDDLITVPDIRIGSLVQENMVVGRTKGDPSKRNNILGMDFLQHYRCEFYFDQNKLVVDQPDSAHDDVPLNILQTGAKFHPYLDVNFEDVSAKAVWDTGASITIVDSAFIDKHANLFIPDGTSEGTDSTGATFETPMFKMKACIIGGRMFPEVRVATVDFSHMNAHNDIPMDMILGYTIYGKANWLFDFPQKQWAFIER